MQANYMRTGAPPELGAMINLGFNGSTPVLLMQGMYVGTAAAGNRASRPTRDSTASSGTCVTPTLRRFPE